MPRSRIDMRVASGRASRWNWRRSSRSCPSACARSVICAGEGLFRAGQPFGHHDAGIVARVDDHAVDQVVRPWAGRSAAGTWSSRPSPSGAAAETAKSVSIVHAAVRSASNSMLIVISFDIEAGRQRLVGVLVHQHGARSSCHRPRRPWRPSRRRGRAGRPARGRGRIRTRTQAVQHRGSPGSFQEDRRRRSRRP